MSYVSLIKNIPEFLSQPTGIAAIASVGIHGAIALIVPLMPVDSNQPKESSPQKTVGVLELSQVDQSRLPQTPGTNTVALQPQLPLLQNQFPQQPQLNTTPNFNTQTTVLPPLPPPITPSSLPPLATIPENYRIPSLPQRQPLRVSRSRSFRFDDSTFNPANNKFARVTPDSFDNKDIVPESSKPVTVDKLPELSGAELPNNLPSTPPVTPSVTPLPTPAATVTPDSNQANTQLSNDAAKLTPITKTPQLGEDLAVANPSIPKVEQGNTPSVPNLPANLRENGEIAQVNSYENLRKALEQQYPNSQEKAVIRSIIPTEKPGLDRTLLGVLVVDTEGKVLDIKFQDRSVPPELQLRTRQYFVRNTPKSDKQISRYPFSLRFQHGATVTDETSQQKAPGVVIPNSGTTTNPSINNKQPAPQPEATSAPVPQVETDKKQPGSTPNAKPSSEQTVKKDDLSSSLESGQELIQKLQNLRETRQQKQNSQSSNE